MSRDAGTGFCFCYVPRMKYKEPWQAKIFDGPRIGFVENFGVPEPVPPPELPPEPAPPPPSPLDKIIDEKRRGFIAEHGAINPQRQMNRNERP
ncbi:hypothetical protein RPMA_09670 [Tardiphaga alba]|uniref:Uncharacterized protein n=1 Tax=Tardiphaga alba TaxID=340268 RepID=A0ABX8A634_9BRAD|nr:hypothetical protein [Tardiphaga alba]QUS39072.1 hypothetical protein RPMA_09670 [Tardiphaga alba]